MARFFYRGIGAVYERDSHGDCSYVKIFILNHGDGFHDILNVYHKKPLLNPVHWVKNIFVHEMNFHVGNRSGYVSLQFFDTLCRIRDIYHLFVGFLLSRTGRQGGRLSGWCRIQGCYTLAWQGYVGNPQSAVEELAIFVTYFFNDSEQTHLLEAGPQSLGTRVVLQPVPRDGAPAHAAWRAWRGCQPRFLRIFPAL